MNKMGVKAEAAFLVYCMPWYICGSKYPSLEAVE